jgi:two-component system NtrC family sensor kinase
VIRDYAPSAPLIRSRLAQMQQVFLNLINNAVDAIGHEGHLTLRVRGEGEGVGVQVVDDGPGIAERDLERIFEPFYSTKGGRLDHSGLGLAICREIMHTLGGTIAVESSPEHGTVFTLWFPAEVPEP